MPHWFVQLVGERMDVTEFPRWFPSGEVYAVQEKDTVYLTGSAFEKYSDADAVREEGRKRLQEYSAIISLLWPDLRSPTVGGIERENERGGRDVWVLVTGAEMRIRAGSVGVFVGQPIGGPSQQPQPTPAQQMLSRVAARERLRSALRLLSQKPLNPNRLYMILETIERDIGPVNRAGLCSNNERERFTGSVNSDEVMGDDARHAAGTRPPPPNPMDLNEAVAFIRRLLVAVLSR